MGTVLLREDRSIKMRWIPSDVQLRNINMSNKSSSRKAGSIKDIQQPKDHKVFN